MPESSFCIDRRWLFSSLLALALGACGGGETRETSPEPDTSSGSDVQSCPDGHERHSAGGGSECRKTCTFHSDCASDQHCDDQKGICQPGAPMSTVELKSACTFEDTGSWSCGRAAWCNAHYCDCNNPASCADRDEFSWDCYCDHFEKTSAETQQRIQSYNQCLRDQCSDTVDGRQFSECAQSNCNPDEVSCQTRSGTCLSAYECAIDCDEYDDACVQKCVEQVSGTARTRIQDLVDCADKPLSCVSGIQTCELSDLYTQCRSEFEECFRCNK